MPAPMVTAEMAGQDLVDWAISLSQHSFELVVDELAEEHRSLSLAQLHRAIQTASITLVEVLQGRERPFALTRDQVMVVRETARHEFPLRDMVRGLRIVQRHWTEVLLDLAERQVGADERSEATRRLLQVLARFFDDTIDSVMVEDLNERKRLLGGALGTRRELVDRVLADEGAWELRAGSHLAVPGGGQLVWAWVSAASPFAPGSGRVRPEPRRRPRRLAHRRPALGRGRTGRLRPEPREDRLAPADVWSGTPVTPGNGAVSFGLDLGNRRRPERRGTRMQHATGPTVRMGGGGA